MKRFITFALLAAVLCTGPGAAAQDEADVEDTRPMWGIKAALDINLPGKYHSAAGSVTMFRHGFGGTLGAVYNIYLGHNFYLEPGASLFYDTYSYKGIVFGSYEGLPGESDPGLYKFGIRIPVVAGYSFNVTDRFAMSVFTGPELSYALAGDIKFKDREALDLNDLHLFGKNGPQRRADCAWKVGVGFPMDGWFVSVEGAFGLTNLNRLGTTFHENRCTIALSRYF